MSDLKTVHQNVIEPSLVATAIFPFPGQKVLSYHPPYNTMSIRFYCLNCEYDRFICRVTYEDELSSPLHGTLVTELDGVKAGIPQQFSINSLVHCLHDGKQEKGKYHVNMYVQTGDTMWNFEYLLTDKDGNPLISKGNEKLYVIAKGEIQSNN